MSNKIKNYQFNKDNKNIGVWQGVIDGDSDFDAIYRLTVDEHIKQLEKLRDVNGYTEFALQYITYHLLEPIEYRSLSLAKTLPNWIEQTKDWWEKEEWMKYGERSTADVGMIWVK